MSVEQEDVVDAIGVDKISDDVMLTISDHLDWSNINSHLLLLQAKLNAYINFVDSGELVEQYPNAIGKAVVYDIVAQYPFCPEALAFFRKVESALEGSDTRLNYRNL
jgi:hypothetical protein